MSRPSHIAEARARMDRPVKIIKKDTHAVRLCDNIATDDGERNGTDEMRAIIANLRSAFINATRQLEKLETQLLLTIK